MYVLCTYLHGRYRFIRESIINIHIQSRLAKVLYCIIIKVYYIKDIVRNFVFFFTFCRKL